ncbi:MAG: hypothetical protein MJ208_02335 [Bacilli bacterium]|nr:hypothetical protein [Bacilli bacterium]
MKNSVTRFDMITSPRKTPWYMQILIWLLCFPSVWRHRAKIKKTNMKGIKPPYLLLCNHNAFLDFKISTAAIFPHRANYIVAIDGFIGREGIMRKIGLICKRKFTSDLVIIHHIMSVIKMKKIMAIYPEARYSLCGTTAVLPESLGKLCKFLNVPVVTLITHGHHINHPFWNTRHERKVKPVEAELKLLFTADEVKNTSVDNINAKLVEAFQYDDFKWQKDNQIKVKCKDRAEGLHRVLYQCPVCGTEFMMDSFGSTLKCNHCGAIWEMTEFGELKRQNGEDKFTHIPDWYEWERANVKNEVKKGTYSSGKLNVVVDSLPNSKGFIRLGKGELIHDVNGFKVSGIDFDNDPFKLEIKPIALYSCHIEYQYLFKHGDCIDLNTINDTWYIYPDENQKFSITKMALATEELYFQAIKKIGKTVKPGLA